MTLWATAAVVAGGPGLAAANVPLSIRVSPSVSFAPADLVVRAVVEVNANNRAIEISAESGDFYRSSEIQLDGEKAPRTSQFEFLNLPRGVYEVRAVLKGSQGQALAFARQRINVVQSGKGS